MSTDIVYDVDKTKEAFTRHTQLSWSSFDNFQTCRGMWFINYFLKSPSDLFVPPIEKENTWTIPGTIIQKVIEVFINERVYKRPEMNSLASLLEWLQKNTNAVYHLGIFPKEYQFQPDFIKTRTFWNNKYGKQQLAYVKQTYGLDDCIKEVNLSFVDKNKFDCTYGSEEAFLNKLNSLYPNILDLFIKENLDLDRVLSEISIKVPVGKFILTGSIDFIYNLRQKDDTCFTSLTQLQDGYFLFDGKYNISFSTKEEQLFFYAMLIYLKTRKIPGRLALLNWNKAAFKDSTFDMYYKTKMESVLSDVLSVGLQVNEFLNKKENKQGLFFQDNFISLNPGKTNCLYCPANSFCPAVEEKGILVDSEVANKIQAKQDAKKAISELTPSPENNPDISL